MRNKKTAFTLVELIVTITILAILGTIGFVSFQDYTVSARDTQRGSDLRTLETGLLSWLTRKSGVPMPDQTKGVITTYASGSSNPIAYQGYVGSDVIRAAAFNGTATDPSSGRPYTYSVNAALTKFQLLALTESQLARSSIVETAYALSGGLYAQYTPYALGTAV